MEEDRKNALCCGGQFLGKNREKFTNLNDMNLTDSIINSADAMVCVCPGCFMYLYPFFKKRGLPLSVVSDLCRMALGEKPFPAS